MTGAALASKNAPATAPRDVHALPGVTAAEAVDGRHRSRQDSARRPGSAQYFAWA